VRRPYDGVFSEESMAQPSANPAPVRDRVAKVINLIRPAVQSDGGDVELVDVTPEGVVQIRLHGACVGCPSSTMTLQLGIERNLKAHVPEVRAVEAVA
jgi:Fe-S cluster biogenesis protein NfuA